MPETVIGFPVLSPGKRFSRVTSAYSVLPLRGAARFSVAQERHGTATTAVRFSPPEEGGEGKHCREVFMLSVASAYFALPVNLLRYAAWRSTGAASRRRPCTPAPASKIAATRSLRLIPAGFGSGRGSVRAKHGPQPASMRAAPAFRERLSDFEAATPAVSATMVNKLTTSRTDRRPGKSQPPPGTKAAPHPLPCPAALLD